MCESRHDGAGGEIKIAAARELMKPKPDWPINCATDFVRFINETMSTPAVTGKYGDYTLVRLRGSMRGLFVGLKRSIQ